MGPGPAAVYPASRTLEVTSHRLRCTVRVAILLSPTTAVTVINRVQRINGYLFDTTLRLGARHCDR